MHKCEKCELAVYCFTEPHTWVFRTKQEMEEKQAVIFGCAVYQQMQADGAPILQECAQASSRR
jgi:hypothetical protein